jgi:ParB-like chromosome segregation protein Spo0J
MKIEKLIDDWCVLLSKLSLEEQVEALNTARKKMHDAGPFSLEPVDCVQWCKSNVVKANDYNPNSVAPPEMELLKVSILEDGYTQPIVAWQREDHHEVVDGFHRNRVGRECMEVNARVCGYLPVAVINGERESRGDRIASTIRHNRARGKHAVGAMSDIVIELKRRNWSNEKISREIGMDQDEILRLCQISGLSELFADQQFSEAWDVEGSITESDFEELTDDVHKYGDQKEGWRTVNTSDSQRIFHTYDKWECHAAGFYATTVKGKTKAECEQEMRDLLVDLPKFRKALGFIVTNWKHSCEHYLTNTSMNRIAWLGQAATCYATGVPSVYRGGFALLTEKQQEKADNEALKYLNKWLKANGRSKASKEQAAPDREMEIY